MDQKIINTFYTGDINQFGFGAYNSKPNYLKLLSKFNYNSTRNNTIDNYFRKKETIKPLHTDFIPNQYKLPPITEKNPLVDFSKSNAQPLKPIYLQSMRNIDNNSTLFSTERNVPNTNFSPPLVKIQNLEDKLQEIEYRNKINLKNSLSNLENKYIGTGRFKQFLDNNKEEIERIYKENYNYQNNITEDPYIVYNNQNPLLDRRKKVKSEINILKNSYTNNFYNNDEISIKKRKKKHKKRRKRQLSEGNIDYDNISEDSKSINSSTPKFKRRSIYSTTSAVSIDKNSLRKSKISLDKLNVKKSTASLSVPRKSVLTGRKSILMGSPPIKNLINLVPTSPNSRKSQLKISPNKRNIISYGAGKILIPNANPITQELQNQNNILNNIINDIYSSAKDLKKDIKEKLDACDINQRNEFNNFQNILNEGGNYKMDLAIQRIINKMKIDINDEPDRLNEYEKRFKKLVDKKVMEYIKFRDNEEIMKKIEEEEDERKRLEIIKKIEEERVEKFLNGNNMVIENLTPLIYKAGKLINYDEDKLTPSSKQNSSSFNNKYFSTSSSKSISLTNRFSSQLTQKLRSRFNTQNINTNLTNPNPQHKTIPNLYQTISNNNTDNNNNNNNNNNVNNNNVNNNNNNVNNNNNNINNNPSESKKIKSSHHRSSSMQVPSNKIEDEQEYVSLKTPRTHQSGINYDDDENSEILQVKIKNINNKSIKQKKKKKIKNSIIEEITNEDL